MPGRLPCLPRGGLVSTQALHIPQTLLFGCLWAFTQGMPQQLQVTFLVLRNGALSKGAGRLHASARGRDVTRSLQEKGTSIPLAAAPKKPKELLRSAELPPPQPGAEPTPLCWVSPSSAGSQQGHRRCSASPEEGMGFSVLLQVAKVSSYLEVSPLFLQLRPATPQGTPALCPACCLLGTWLSTSKCSILKRPYQGMICLCPPGAKQLPKPL